MRKPSRDDVLAELRAGLPARGLWAALPELVATGALPFEEGAVALVRRFARHHLAPPVDGDRDAFAERCAEAFVRGERFGTPASERDGELWEAIARWRAESDPGRARLEALFDAVEQTDPTTAGLTPQQAWGRDRFRVERALEPLVVPIELSPPEDLVAADGSALDWLASQTGVIGVAGPAAAGKTSLARQVPGAAVLDCDALTFPGDGFRYTQRSEHRDVRLFGPAIYDDAAIVDAIDAAASRERLLLVVGVYVGLDCDVRDRLDGLLVVGLDHRVRLERKSARDEGPRGRVIDVRADFALKQFHEVFDGVRPLLNHADAFWDAGTPQLYSRVTRRAHWRSP